MTLPAQQPRSSHGWLNAAVPMMATAALLTGSIQLMGYTYAWPLWLSMVVLTVIGFSGMGILLYAPGQITAWSVYGISIALAYGFGTLNSMTSGYLDGSAMFLINFAGPNALGLALGMMTLIVATMLFASHFDKNKIIPLQSFTDSERSAALVVLVATTAGTFIALATGQLGFGGVQTGSTDTVLVSPLASLITSCLTPVTGMAILAFANQERSRTRWIVIALCLLLAGTQVTQGRRLFLFNLLTLMMAFFAARGIKRFVTPRTIGILVLTLITVWGASRFFVSMRIAGYSLPQDATLGQRLEGAVDVIRNPEANGLDEHIEQNQSTRTFLVGYVGELIQAYERTGRTTGGDLLILNAASAFPTALWPGKWRIMMELGSDEIACHRAMGIPAWDAGNTVITEGLCDFGWTGMLLYPVAVVGLLTLVNFAVRRMSIVIRALVAFATIKSLLGVEGVLTGYLVDLRNTTLLVVGTYLLIQAFSAIQKLPLMQHARKQRLERLQRQAAGGQ